MNESVSERAKHEAEISRSQLPVILEELRKGRELDSIASRIAEETGVPSLTSYKWVYEVDRQFQTDRRRVAVLGAVFLWVAAILAALAVLLPLVFGVDRIAGLPASVVSGGFALASAVPALVFSFGARRFAARRGFKEK